MSPDGQLTFNPVRRQGRVPAVAVTRLSGSSPEVQHVRSLAATVHNLHMRIRSVLQMSLQTVMLQQSTIRQAADLLLCAQKVLKLLDVPNPGYDSFRLDSLADRASGSGKVSAVGALQGGR